MARLHSATPAPELSVLDRLLDDDRDTQSPEPPREYAKGVSELRRAVLRDVQWILNARVGEVFAEREQLGRTVAEPEQVLRSSVLRFGIRDFTNLDLRNSRQQELLRRRILLALESFEPRLDHIEVHVDTDTKTNGRTRFRIDARLTCDPEPVQLSFDATVLWKDRRVEVA